MTHLSGQLALMIDLERCTGCKSCEAACKQTNGLGPGSYRNRVMWFDEQAEPTGGNDSSRLDFLTVTCQQCERPACLRACLPGCLPAVCLCHGKAYRRRRKGTRTRSQRSIQLQEPGTHHHLGDFQGDIRSARRRGIEGIADRGA